MVLKKQYLDERKNQKKESDGAGSNLSGQGWYMQSASRAVNQAVGRVIRHKNDWGAIFLMDDRFLSDQQSSQLSKWVKNEIKHYPKAQGHGQHQNPFLAALNHFHGFARQAMLNTQINPKTTIEQKPVKNKPRFQETSRDGDDDDDDDEFSSLRKVVVLNADAVKDANSSSFVNPSLLVSQTDNEKTRVDVRATGVGFHKAISEKDTEVDLLSMIERMKKDSTKPTSALSTSSKSLSSQLSQSMELSSNENNYKSLRMSIKNTVAVTNAQNPFAKNHISASSSSSSSSSSAASAASSSSSSSASCLNYRSVWTF